MSQVQGSGDLITQPNVLRPDTFFDYLLVIYLEGTYGEDGGLISCMKS